MKPQLLEFDWQGCGSQYLESYKVSAVVLRKLCTVQPSSLSHVCVHVHVLTKTNGQPWVLFLKYK